MAHPGPSTGRAQAAGRRLTPSPAAGRFGVLVCGRYRADPQLVWPGRDWKGEGAVEPLHTLEVFYDYV